MDNDLISRSELRKHAFTMYQSNGVALEPLKVVPLGCIDNAPTVEERPQGEWKFIQGATTQGSLKCPFCDYRDYHKTNSNFCPNCGAKMKQD